MLKANAVAAPFFGTRTHFVRGLDPLGLQTTSEATFAFLLPGLNNVTGRIRYYSFYCWLLTQYARNSGSEDPKKQEAFIRRAELLLALLHRSADEEERAIPGSNFALARLRESNGGSISIARGVYDEDGGTEKTYWKYSLGAFGQYYLGSLTEIGLVTNSTQPRTYRRTSNSERPISGEAVAAAFEESVPARMRQRFLELIGKDTISPAALEDLRDGFNMAAIPALGNERDLLQKLLLGPDYPALYEEQGEPSTMRRQTIAHLLRAIKDDANRTITPYVFTQLAYLRFGEYNGQPDGCLTGWYFYELNEYWQYACTAMLNASMDFLFEKAGNGWIPFSKFTNALSDGTLKAARKLGIIPSHDITTGEWLQNAPTNAEVDILNDHDESRGLERAAHALNLVRTIAERNSERLEALRAYGQRSNIIRGDASAVDSLTRIHTYRDMPVGDFIQHFLVNSILRRHQYVAFRKMGGTGNRSTQRFVLEEGSIRYLDGFTPTFTGPRIRNLLRFLEDLNLVATEGDRPKLTESGQKLLDGL